MSVTITPENLPQFDSAVGIPGKKRLLYVNYGTGATAATPNWTLIGGAEDFTMSPTVNTQSKTTKDSGNWSIAAPTGKSFEISSKLVAIAGDVGQNVLKSFIYDDKCTDKNALQFAYVDVDSKDYMQFAAIPTGFEETSSAADLVEYSFKATGTGKPETKTGFTAGE